ncbi:outer membrane beta-barrel family protein [Aureivirga sp. CE67]|uniref:outer membrane beta-barrel family protein n=1 Tax=Aureivirga sp. CE67 TaxID=1788983 RepID=UPI0018CA9E41|nr:outer membrane beta-barrel family protein [Aureivirga sp. CE67]
MNRIITQLFFFLFVVFGLQQNFAQKGNVQIIGKVVEEANQQPIAFATVILKNKNTNENISGTTTSDDGSFEMTSKTPDFYIEVSFMGFATKTIKNFTTKNGQADFGLIVLKADVETLEDVTIIAEKSQTEFKLDKKVFNVGKDLISSGASAMEVLNNVPSVNVSIEGAISLRGSEGVQILINGKPSVLTNGDSNGLGTITADMIQSVEVITNPSAKYNAEGTSGIINLILKKDEKKGINGSVTLNTGSPNNHSVGLSLNKRTEKFNIFSQFGVGRRTFPFESERTNTYPATATSTERELTTIGDGNKNEKFYNVVLGTDYHINENNVITLSGNFAFEDESEDSDLAYYNYLAGTLNETTYRNENTTATNPKWQYDLQYKKDFEDHKDHSLLLSATGSFFGKDKKSLFEDINSTNSSDLQKTATDFKEAEYSFKLDYTHPFWEKYKFETGFQYDMNDVSNDYSVANLINDEYIIDPNFTNIFDYDQKVLGVYGTTSYEGEKWGIMLGLRLEDTNVNTLLKNTNEKNDQKYTNLFPSLHSSYKFTDDFSMQVGYSRRIRRPNLWNLNPFTSFRDKFNISAGNPNLQPEFTDSYEFTAIYKFNKGNVNLGVYHLYTTDVMERITSTDGLVYITQPENIGTNAATGLELNMKYNPFRWFTLTGNFNYNYFDRKGDYEETSFDFTGDRFTSRMTGKFKLPAKFDLEVSGNYSSKYKTLQGENNDNLFANLGVRKKILKGKMVLNLSVRDVFASRVFESFRNIDGNTVSSTYKRGRFVTFGVSFGFGKGEAMEFSGHKRF